MRCWSKRFDPVQLRVILEHLRERGDTREIAYCLTVLTVHAAQMADYKSPASAESLRLWQAGDPFYIAYALTRNAYARPDNLEYIIACLRQSARIQRETGNWIHVCTSLMFLAELLGLACCAPQELSGWMAHWQLLTERRRDLEATLGAEPFAATWERGSKLDMNAVVEQLLAELQGTQPPEC